METYTRVFVDADDLDSISRFCQALLGRSESLRFDYAELDLRLVAVSSSHLSVLIIAGPPEKRRPFEGTRLTIKVEALEPAVALPRTSGAEQLEPIQRILVGRKTRFRYADGIVVEYVNHSSVKQP